MITNFNTYHNIIKNKLNVIYDEQSGRISTVHMYNFSIFYSKIIM